MEGTSRPKRLLDLTGNGLQDRFFMSGGSVVEKVWHEAVRRREVVGHCRQCDGAMFGVEDDRWMEARCGDCGHSVALSLRTGGWVLRKSSRRSEMPPGFWEQRRQSMIDAARAISGHGSDD